MERYLNMLTSLMLVSLDIWLCTQFSTLPGKKKRHRYTAESAFVPVRMTEEKKTGNWNQCEIFSIFNSILSYCVRSLDDFCIGKWTVFKCVRNSIPFFSSFGQIHVAFFSQSMYKGCMRIKWITLDIAWNLFADFVEEG